MGGRCEVGYETPPDRLGCLTVPVAPRVSLEASSSHQVLADSRPTGLTTCPPGASERVTQSARCHYKREVSFSRLELELLC